MHLFTLESGSLMAFSSISLGSVPNSLASFVLGRKPAR